jgi:hypothetical protein
MRTAHSPRQNHLLAALLGSEGERLFPHLELVELPLGHVLNESGERVESRLFPYQRHRVIALRHSGWRISRNRCGRQ